MKQKSKRYCANHGIYNLDELFYNGAKIARGTGLVKTGVLIVITEGIPIGVTGSTNLLKVERIGK
ncbi:pyruvate kinase alpha/beta domain-containing protein [Chloroflexota bacterium]